jgi:hypothetical protein
MHRIVLLFYGIIMGIKYGYGYGYGWMELVVIGLEYMYCLFIVFVLTFFIKTLH